MKCPFCALANDPAANFCPSCGSPLHLQICPECETVNNKAASKCIACGNALLWRQESPVHNRAANNEPTGNKTAQRLAHAEQGPSSKRPPSDAPNRDLHALLDSVELELHGGTAKSSSEPDDEPLSMRQEMDWLHRFEPQVHVDERHPAPVSESSGMASPAAAPIYEQAAAEQPCAGKTAEADPISGVNKPSGANKSSSVNKPSGAGTPNRSRVMLAALLVVLAIAGGTADYFRPGRSVLPGFGTTAAPPRSKIVVVPAQTPLIKDAGLSAKPLPDQRGTVGAPVDEAAYANRPAPLPTTAPAVAVRETTPGVASAPPASPQCSAAVQALGLCSVDSQP